MTTMIARTTILLVAIGACGRLRFDILAADGNGDALVEGHDGVLPANTNIAFVTSTRQAPASLGGLAGADALCNTRATNAMLPGTYVAWLSTATVDARDRLAGSRGWVRTDGLPFVDTIADLDAGVIDYPLALDETTAVSVFATTNVVTGTQPDGTLVALDCAGYTTDDGSNVVFGTIADTVIDWTSSLQGPNCASLVPLYCFGVGNTTPVTLPPITTRRAFVSSTGVVGDAALGIGHADTVCQNTANAAGLSGTFKALLATAGSTAIERFTMTSNWVRTDGVPIATSPAELGAGNWLAAIDRGADGAPVVPSGVWTGASGPNIAGTNATSCMGWTRGTNAFFGDYGLLNKIYGAFFALGSPTGCDKGLRYYCLEE